MKSANIFLIGALLLAIIGGVVVTVHRRNTSPPEQTTVGVSNGTSQLAGLFAQATRLPDITDPAPTPFKLGIHSNGALRFLSPRRGWRIPANASRIADAPAEVAREFMLEHRSAFGLASSRNNLVLYGTRPNAAFTTVRLQQTYAGLPVLAAEAVVHVGIEGEIRTVLADFATDTANVDRMALPLTPTISATDAQSLAVTLVQTHLRRGSLKPGAPLLIVYAPDVLGLPGVPAIAWEVPVESWSQPFSERGRAIVDASSGILLNYLDEVHSATNRRIYDDNNSATNEPTLGGTGDDAVRVEGGMATGIAEVDDLYDYIGQTDALYLANHGRDGYDGVGGIIYAIARSVPAGQAAPWPNASAGGNVMSFGAGYITDDIVAHEYTHLVTEQTSRLIYQNASGAINEALSDIWGEFLDQSNGSQTPNGDDSAGVRWQVGEDRPGGALRSMSNPPLFNDPDRRGSSRYIPVAVLPDGGVGGNDSGGVHSNSGVANKLCYLLVDGDTFNGQTITGEGFPAVAALFYEVQVNFLLPAADWRDLYFSITTAAAEIGWSQARQANLGRACIAVEISTDSHEYFVDQSSPTTTGDPPQPVLEVGIPNVVGTLGPFRSIPAGLAVVNDGGILSINAAAGDYSMGFGSVVTLSKPVTLNSYNGETRILP